MSVPFSHELLTRMPVIGILRNVPLADIREVLPIYQEVGFTTIEITMNTPGAADCIRYARTHFAGKLNVGAGTVCNPDDLNLALHAGAQFVVTPVLSKRIVRSCVGKGVPVFPGAYTPTEIFKAWKWGATMVKIFPATALGPSFVKDLKAPLPYLKLVPTGGIDLHNLAQFMQAGADALGIGSQLFDKKMIQQRDWSGLRQHLSHYHHLMLQHLPKP